MQLYVEMDPSERYGRVSFPPIVYKYFALFIYLVINLILIHM